MAGFLIGVDVGPGSARAGVFDRDGAQLAHIKRDIVIFRDDRGHIEQSSTQVWQAVREAVSEAVAGAGDLGLRWCRATPLIRQLLSDATGLPVEVTACPEPVLLSSTMLGAFTASVHPDLKTAMSHIALRCQPREGAVCVVHDHRYRAFLSLQKVARELRADAATVLN